MILFLICTRRPIFAPFIAHVYYEFVPGYRSTDCQVVVEYSIDEKAFRGKSNEWHGLHSYRPVNWLNFSSSYFLYENYPTAASVVPKEVGSGSPGRRFVFQLTDQCERRKEIFDAVKEHLLASYAGVAIEVEIPENPMTLNQFRGRGLWIDSPFLDEDYWDVLRRAQKSCDPDDWLRFAELHFNTDESHRRMIEEAPDVVVQVHTDREYRYSAIALLLIEDETKKNALAERLKNLQEKFPLVIPKNETYDHGVQISEAAKYWLENQSDCLKR